MNLCECVSVRECASSVSVYMSVCDVDVTFESGSGVLSLIRRPHSINNAITQSHLLTNTHSHTNSRTHSQTTIIRYLCECTYVTNVC